VRRYGGFQELTSRSRSDSEETLSLPVQRLNNANVKANCGKHNVNKANMKAKCGQHNVNNANVKANVENIM
jgi:hypothetical protein